MMLHETDQGNGHFHELKRLLLEEEQQKLERLGRDVDDFAGKFGSSDKFERAVANSLVAALRQAEVEDHRGLSAAIAPLVVAGIRSEIAQSRDMMVEALYPITGRLVSTAVAKAFQNLLADINARLESALSPRRWRLRLKAFLTGRSYGELVLAEATAFRPQQILLIDHSNGTMIGSWPPTEAGSGENLTLVGGMLSAILDFAEEALRSKGGGIRSIDLGGRKAFLRASPRFAVAAIGLGSSSAPIEDAVDDAFLGFLETLPPFLDSAGQDPIRDVLRGLHDDLIDRLSQIEASRQPRLAYFIVGGLALAFAGLIGYQVWQAREQSLFSARLAEVATNPVLGGYPIVVTHDRSSDIVRVRGLVPNITARDVIIAEAGKIAGKIPVEAELVAVDTERMASLERVMVGFGQRFSALDAQKADEAAIARLVEAVASVDARISGLGAAVGAAPSSAELAATEAKLAATEASLAAALDAQGKAEARIADLEGELGSVKAQVDLPIDRLRRFIDTTAIFFGNGIVYSNDVAAGRSLAALAEMLAAAPDARLRIIGYADETGNKEANLVVAQRRAEKVVADLAERGIAAGRLVIVGRPEAPGIANTSGPTSANRRVDFALAFQGE